MKVHIVLWHDNHILPRMTEWLVERNGWTVGDEPDPGADVNYFMPYLKWSLETHPQTATAGWFTHYETGNEWKVRAWQDAGMFIDMPCVTAPMYTSILKNARVITPGVNRERFTPGKREPNERPIVGIAGIGQPRKGPHLIVDLYYGGLAADVHIVGMQWPFPHTMIANNSMPEWYRSLDVYLCTSTIEGIPAPVLEALATDVKVVVPDGVGICDQLPEMEGIRHYSKGDSEDMIRALRQVIADKPSKGALRDVTDDYTIDDWCYSHRLAMEELLDARVSV